MMIDRDNYESYFIDFLDGNLENESIDQFLLFLDQNPDLKEELQNFDSFRLPEEPIVFSGKKQLYKVEADQHAQIENKMIALLEGDLENDERQSFEKYLTTHPELQKEYQILAKTRLIPEAGIRFPSKHKLYRKSGFVIAFQWVGRAAAVLLLVWAINSVFQEKQPRTPEKQGKQLASVVSEPKPPVKNSEAETKNQKVETKTEQAEQKVKPAKTKSIREKNKGRLEEKKSILSESVERDMTRYPEIRPLTAMLESFAPDRMLAVSHSGKKQKETDSQKVMNLEEFLASRAKKIGSESLSSAQRLLRTSLNIASEISGERIVYAEKNGTITSVDFETKLLAFSIPLKKE